jgi:N-acetyl-gamma-glutamyl-phosphate reductase
MVVCKALAMNPQSTLPAAARKLTVAVIGAAGYSGAVLIEQLLGHPGVRIVGVFGSAKRDAQTQLFSEVFTRFRGLLDLPIRATDVRELTLLAPDVIFLATPHEASEELAPQLLETGACVIDLSAAFRFADSSVYPVHYKFTHRHPELLSRAVYGLPELFRARLLNAKLIAVPGCYPTSAILPLSPLVKAGALACDSKGVPVRPIIDATSGVSGAGRALKQGSLFCEVSLQPYGVFSHRHNPEIDEYAGVRTIFTPHLGAYDRGILSTIHVELAPGWDESRVRETLQAAYADEPFVRLCVPNVWPSLIDVRHTNFCDIAVACEPGGSHCIIISAIDNLMKGAAGQAIQAMNAAFGVPETLGLPVSAGARGLST